MAAVYAATHRNQAEFAVKMLHPDLSSREDIRTRFLREGYIANSVKHPGAVRVVDDDVAEDGAAFLVMELLDGMSVEDLWFQSERRIPLAPALAIAHQLLDVLSAAHAKTIVHRDIKPANLFVMTSGEVKVLDFGIARLRASSMNSLHATTQSGTMLGTPAFMAPEQARGQTKEVDGRTDVWAVGATLFSLVSGHLVHEAESAPQLLLRAATTPARSLRTVAPDLPPAIVALVDKALAFDKPARWPDSGAMRDALRDACVEALGSPPSRDALTAFVAELQEAPACPAAPPASADEKRPTPPPPAESLVSTKVEGKGGPKLASTLPLAQKAPEQEQSRPPEKPQEKTLPMGQKSPLTPAPPKDVGLSTAKPVAKEPAPAALPAAAPRTRRSTIPLVVGLVVAAAVLLGLALSSLQSREPAQASPPPPAVSSLPEPSSTAPSTP